MIIVESLLKEKHNLIQVTLDEVMDFFKNTNDEKEKFVLDFIEACKQHPIPAIFFGNKKNIDMNLQIPQYLDFVKQLDNKINTVVKQNCISILKNSHFVLLLNNNPITRYEYEEKLEEFKTLLPNINLPKIHVFKEINFGLQFEEILIDILDNKSKHIISEDLFESKLSPANQVLKNADYHNFYGNSPNNPANPLIRYFNSYFKSKKDSNCVNLSVQSKTDIYYKNKNGSLNEISIKTKYISKKTKQMFKKNKSEKLKIKLSTSSLELSDWLTMLYADPIKTIKNIFNRTYCETTAYDDNSKYIPNSPYDSRKNDNVKFLLLYFYNLDNPNRNLSGEVHILNMKRMFNLLLHYMNNNMVRCKQDYKSLTILVNGEPVFKISDDYYNIGMYAYFDINNPSSFFTQLIDFKMPLHLDSECWKELD